ncbi:phage tail tube protein [Streptomyces prunicolor]|uniref:phage tail tube protein n=1 Tax=Streptomyces prunicolor TaxID=67348 RepID=UPI0009966EA6|nr:hypothetical protein [Streptomyces prunicolor]
MSVNVSNLVQGPATLYIGAFGAAEPTSATATPASGVWTDLGGTLGGAEVSIAQEYKAMEVDQIVDVPGSRLVSRAFTIKTQLAEPTLQNLFYALNDGTYATGASDNTYEPNFQSSATQPTYRAILLDGWAPNGAGKKRKLIARRVLSTDAVVFSYKKDDQSVFSVTFTAHYVDSSTGSFKVIDQAN